MPFDVPPSAPPFLDEELTQIAQALVRVITKGATNTVSDVTLTENQLTTVVDDSRVGPETVISLMPKTANAAAAIPTTYISNRTDEQFTITHANNAQTDRDFSYSVVG